MVTAETALSLPAVVLVLLMVLAAVSAGVTQLRVADAARTAARQAAIGQEDYAGAAQRVAGGVSLGLERGELTVLPPGWTSGAATGRAGYQRKPPRLGRARLGDRLRAGRHRGAAGGGGRHHGSHPGPERHRSGPGRR